MAKHASPRYLHCLDQALQFQNRRVAFNFHMQAAVKAAQSITHDERKIVALFRLLQKVVKVAPSWAKKIAHTIQWEIQECADHIQQFAKTVLECIECKHPKIAATW